MRILVSVACAVCALTIGLSRAPAQSETTRRLYVTVTDPMGRPASGLGQEQFVVLEQGTRREVTGFSSPAAPMSIAIVGTNFTDSVVTLGPEDEFIRALSVAEALQRLATSDKQRKTIVTAASGMVPTVPEGVQILKAESAEDLVKALARLRNRYELRFQSSDPLAPVQILVDQPAVLPRLRARSS